MVRLGKRLLLSVIAVSAVAPTTLLLAPAHAASSAQDQKVNACSLLSTEEVKKYAPWPPMLDQFKPEEETLANGSACNYPSVYIQVMSMSESGWKRWLDTLKSSPVEPVAAVGDEAYIRDNKGRFAELVTKVGTQVLTIQYSLKEQEGETTQAVKPRLIALAKALTAKLP